MSRSKTLKPRSVPRDAARRTLRVLLPKQLVEAIGFFQDRRVAKWWNYILESDRDPGSFAEDVRRGLETDEDATMTAILAAARAAADAFDPVVLESIALLTRMHVQTGSPGRVAYRDLLDMFTGLAEDEFYAMRRAMQVLKTVPRFKGGAGEPGGAWAVTNLMFDAAPEINDWNWYAIIQQKTFQLARGDVAVRVVDALERLGRAHFAITNRSGQDATARKGSVMHPTIDLLSDVMPPPGEESRPLLPNASRVVDVDAEEARVVAEPREQDRS